MNVAAQRRRLFITLGVNVACAIVAVAALIVDAFFHVPGAMVVVGVVLAAGFGTQFWLIWGFVRDKR